MKSYLIRLVLSVVVLLSASTARGAYVFFALNEDDVIIYYSILSTQERTCRVSNIGGPSCYSGVVRIPEKVSCNSVEFQVVGIEANTFNTCYNLTSVEIPETVTFIGSNAFSGCRALKSITIPSGVSIICQGAFYGCSSLTSITIPDGITSIEQYAFYNCTNLTSMTIPDNVTSIGMAAFWGCTDLTSVTIGKSVQTIGDRAFDECNALKEVTSRIENPFVISSDCFSDKVKSSALLKVPKGTMAKYQSTRYWMTFSNIIEAETEYRTMKLSDDLQLFIYSENLDFSGCQNLNVYTACGFNLETNEVLMMPVTVVPAGTGVLIKGGTETFYPSVSNQSSIYYPNFLVGNLTERSLTDGYLLKGDAFVRVDAPTTIPANSVYLAPPANVQGAKRLSMKFLEDETDIEQVEIDKTMSDGNWYTLQGTRLNGTPTTHGIYIRNGRKVYKR